MYKLSTGNQPLYPPFTSTSQHNAVILGEAVGIVVLSGKINAQRILKEKERERERTSQKLSRFPLS